MGKKNWIEFDNQEKNSEETAKLDTVNKKSKLNISKPNNLKQFGIRFKKIFKFSKCP